MASFIIPAQRFRSLSGLPHKKGLYVKRLLKVGIDGECALTYHGTNLPIF
jgi:hypothetical protein